MARATNLKVFRTAIGFHDAYIAAASQKAALEAWGSDKNLFARGAAEQVTDAALMAEPLAAPGKVIKRLRGTVAEQLAALPADKPKRPPAKPVARSAPAAPKPSRAALDKAEAAIAGAEKSHADALAALAAREKKLAEERRELRRTQEEAMAELEACRDAAADAYGKAMSDWDS